MASQSKSTSSSSSSKPSITLPSNVSFSLPPLSYGSLPPFCSTSFSHNPSVSLPSFSYGSLPAFSPSTTRPPLPVFPKLGTQNTGKAQIPLEDTTERSKTSVVPPANITTNDVMEMMSQMRSYMEEQTRTNYLILKEMQGRKKNLAVEHCPLRSRELNFDAPRSSRILDDDLIPM